MELINIAKILQNSLTKTFLIEWTTNVALAIGDKTTSLQKEAQNYESILHHYAKYFIRDLVNTIGNKYMSLEQYECDKHLLTKECAAQIGIGSLAAILVTPMKAVLLANNNPGKISYLQALPIIFFEQFAYELTGKFKFSDQDEAGTVSTILAIETMVGHMTGTSLIQGAWVGTVVALNTLGPYSFVSNMNNSENINESHPLCLPSEASICEQIICNLNSTYIGDLCFDIS